MKKFRVLFEDQCGCIAEHHVCALSAHRAKIKVFCKLCRIGFDPISFIGIDEVI